MNIALLTDEFSVGTPSQQILDRFLIGYPKDGRFHRIEKDRLVACLLGDHPDDELQRRKNDHGLTISNSLPEVVAESNCLVLVGDSKKKPGILGFINDVLKHAKPESKCFVYGALANSLARAQSIVDLAHSKGVLLTAGTAASVTWRLPQTDVEPNRGIDGALVIAHEPGAWAELEALDVLFSLIEKRPNGESGVGQLRQFQGDALWQAAKDQVWSWPLMTSAISRTNSKLGDAVKDSRTQDIVGLNMVPKLAKNPYAWVLDHDAGLRTSILGLNGVINDDDFAVQMTEGTVVSAQIYKPPKPHDHQFSKLVESIESFFRSGQAVWPTKRNVLICGLLEEFEKIRLGGSASKQTPHLRLPYSVSGIDRG